MRLPCMASLSPWLQGIERLSIEADNSQPTQDYIRKAPSENQFSTAQAAAWVLAQHNEAENAALLWHTFVVFNQHCIATRRNITPIPGPSHHFLEQAKHHAN